MSQISREATCSARPCRAPSHVQLTVMAFAMMLHINASPLALAQPAAADPASWVVTPEIIRAIGPDQEGNYNVGDMVFSEQSLEELEASPRGALSGNRWPGGNVFYSFDPNVSESRRQMFRAAAAWWADVSGVSFHESSTAANRIRVVVPDAAVCNSNVGMIGGVQVMNLGQSPQGSTCWTTRIVAHEIGHALGLVHEQNRSDRSPFVNVTTTGGGSAACNALIASNWGIWPSNMITNYDFGSLMHYRSVATLSSIDCPTGVTGTITAISAQPPGLPAGSQSVCQSPPQCTDVMGNGSALSARDGWAIAQHYGFRIEVTVGGSGGGNVSASGHWQGCGNDCYLVMPGATFSLTAIPSAGSVARISSATCYSTTGTCQISPLANHRVRVNFIRLKNLWAIPTIVTTLLGDDDPIFGNGFE